MSTNKGYAPGKSSPIGLGSARDYHGCAILQYSPTRETSVTLAAVGGGPGGSCSFSKFEAYKHRKFMNGTYFERGDDNLSEYYRII